MKGRKITIDEARRIALETMRKVDRQIAEEQEREAENMIADKALDSLAAEAQAMGLYDTPFSIDEYNETRRRLRGEAGA